MPKPEDHVDMVSLRRAIATLAKSVLLFNEVEAVSVGVERIRARR